MIIYTQNAAVMGEHKLIPCIIQIIRVTQLPLPTFRLPVFRERHADDHDGVAVYEESPHASMVASHVQVPEAQTLKRSGVRGHDIGDNEKTRCAGSIIGRTHQVDTRTRHPSY